METKEIVRAIQVPPELQRAAKVALAVGANVQLGINNDALLVKFKDSDSYYFDPDTATLHALEAVDNARRDGFAALIYDPGDLSWATIRNHLVVRIIFSSLDVRVQIGASRWYVGAENHTVAAMRNAIVDAFCAYYDAEIAPKPAA